MAIYSRYTLNKKLVKVGQMGIKGASSLVNPLVDITSLVADPKKVA